MEGRHREREWCHVKKRNKDKCKRQKDQGTVIQAEGTRVRRGTNRKSVRQAVIERQTELQETVTVTEKDEPLAELHTGNKTSYSGLLSAAGSVFQCPI